MMQKIFRSALAVALLALIPSTARAGEVKVTLNQGLVTIIADDAPISRILAEWARVGQTKIVNGDKMMTVVSLQLVDIPERQALDILLRSASGYMAAERPAALQGASAFDRIMILPFSRPPAASPVMTTNSVPQPFNQQPRPVMPQPDMDDAPVMPPGMGQQGQPNAGQQTAPMPGMLPPTGNQNGNPGQTQQTLPRPGFLPVPAGPQQPVPFGAPAVPGKPPGGGGGQKYEPDRN